MVKMGIDLNLLPMMQGISSNFSHEIISLDRNYELFDRIRAIPSLPISDGFACHHASFCHDDVDEGYGDVVEDYYGTRLRYTLAVELKKVNIPGPPGAFVHALNDDVPIVLFWR